MDSSDSLGLEIVKICEDVSSQNLCLDSQVISVETQCPREFTQRENRSFEDSWCRWQKYVPASIRHARLCM